MLWTAAVAGPVPLRLPVRSQVSLALQLLRESPQRGLGAGLCHQDAPAVPAESDATGLEGRGHRHHGPGLSGLLLGRNLGSQEEKLWVSSPQRPS